MKGLKRLFDVQLPFFIPLWRRIVLVGACLGWAGMEAYWGNAFWAGLFGLIGLWCGHQFFFDFDLDDPAHDAEADKQDPDEGT